MVFLVIYLGLSNLVKWFIIWRLYEEYSTEKMVNEAGRRILLGEVETNEDKR